MLATMTRVSLTLSSRGWNFSTPVVTRFAILIARAAFIFYEIFLTAALVINAASSPVCQASNQSQ
jgi:hypothetical protein